MGATISRPGWLLTKMTATAPALAATLAFSLNELEPPRSINATLPRNAAASWSGPSAHGGMVAIKSQLDALIPSLPVQLALIPAHDSCTRCAGVSAVDELGLRNSRQRDTIGAVTTLCLARACRPLTRACNLVAALSCTAVTSSRPSLLGGCGVGCCTGTDIADARSG